jgi:hypothetical protein
MAQAEAAARGGLVNRVEMAGMEPLPVAVAVAARAVLVATVEMAKWRVVVAAAAVALASCSILRPID